jgi:subtilisin family serine protease
VGMKGTRALVIGLCLLFIFSSWGAMADNGGAKNEENGPGTAPEYVPGELLIKFKGNTPADKEKDLRESVKAKEVGTFNSMGVRHWKLGEEADVLDAIESLQSHKYKDEIEYVEPNGYRYTNDIATIPSDSYRGELWAMHNIGQTGGAADADIDALESWQVYNDAGTIVVAILDSGIDYNHEDLKDNIWENPGEKGLDAQNRDKRTNGVDDDGNGYVDDWRGWDFVNNDNDPMDDYGHGTHIAGTIGAVGNNGLGVAGVCWKVQLMALKFLNSGGSGTVENQVKAIEYAKWFNVPITSNSYGGTRKFNTEQNAIQSFGALFVCAAGNSGSTTKWYPAGYTLNNILSVAATGPSDELASWSNYGSDWVDVGAPGVDILSSVPNNGYEFLNGTSMATPHVTGAAALVLKKNSSFTAVQVKNQIMNTVEAKSSLSGKTVTGGRLNVRAALGLTNSFTDTVDPGTIASISEDSAKATLHSVTLTWTAKGDDGDSTGRAYLYDLRYRTDGPVTSNNWATSTRFAPTAGPGLPASTESIAVTGLREGTKYYFGLMVADELGRYSSMTTGEATTKKEPTAFSSECVDSLTSSSYVYQTLAYDPNGVPSMVYTDFTNSIIYYVKKTPNGWVRETIEAVKSMASLAFDSTGKPCIAYGSGTLKYARYDGTKWTYTTLEGQGIKVYFGQKSLAFDKDGNPGIVYFVGGSGMKYAHYSGSSWSTVMVDSTARTSFPAYCSLAYNPGQADRPAIAYSDSPNSGDYLRYAEYDGSKWNVVNVKGDVREHYGYFPSLAFDSSNKPTIGCRNNYTIYLFHRDANGVWISDSVLTTEEYLGITSMCYSSTGVPYISYSVSDPLNQASKVRLLHRGPNGWEDELVDSAKGPGTISMKTYKGASSETIGVTYANNQQLFYASRSL